MKVPLAGPDAAGNATETILSEVGGMVLLRMFTMAEACTLRLVCREFVEAVRQQQWEDRETVIKGSVGAWRRCFPRARFPMYRCSILLLRISCAFSQCLTLTLCTFRGCGS